MCKVKSKLFLISVIFILITVLIVFSDICKTGVERGIMICGNVIIPSLFPFTVCVLMLMNLNITVKNKVFLKFIYYTFGQSFEMFCVMFFSMLGGYPIGCKLINDIFKNEKINSKAAHIMQMYCVNAGPAFIISAVGCGVLRSKAVGIILFLSHISVSFVMAICSAKILRKNYIITEQRSSENPFSEIFVNSVYSASTVVMSICAYVILFSCLNTFIAYFFENFKFLKSIIFFTEITSGITHTKSVIFISFLLGFAGISVWCQIFALSKNVKIDFKLFILGRILHGGVSAAVTFLLLKVFNVSLTVFANIQTVDKKFFYDGVSLSISLAIMLIVLFIFIYTKNCSRKITKDMI